MKKKNSVRYIVLAIVLIAIAVIVLFLINGRETIISGEDENDTISSLVCHSSGREDAFFSSSLVNTIDNEVKITYKNEEFDKLFYTYSGVYRSNEVAKSDEAALHAKYNIYLGENDVSQEDITSSFFVTNTKFHINLYVENYDKINSTTAILFFIDKDDIKDFENKSIKELEKYYEEKGFSCKVNE